MKHRIFLITIFVLYLLLATILMIWRGIGITPDRFALLLLLGAVIIKKFRRFTIDWLPFLFILISYDFLRGLADDLNPTVHYFAQIRADTFVFHNLPTVILQKIFFNPNHSQWYDYAATIIYFLHFALPLSFAFLLWIYRRSLFREFVTAISLLSYGAWLTYLVYPAAPPWLASRFGMIPHVTKIMDGTLVLFPQTLDVPSIYYHFSPNLVAAIPSLHAAYPYLIWLFGLRYFGKKFSPFIFYVLAVWLSTVYLGEHYVLDIVIGVIYAHLFFILSVNFLHNKKKTLLQSYN